MPVKLSTDGTCAACCD